MRRRTRGERGQPRAPARRTKLGATGGDGSLRPGEQTRLAVGGAGRNPDAPERGVGGSDEQQNGDDGTHRKNLTGRDGRKRTCPLGSTDTTAAKG